MLLTKIRFGFKMKIQTGKACPGNQVYGIVMNRIRSWSSVTVLLAACLVARDLQAEPPPTASRLTWRRAWTYTAGAPLTGAPVPLGAGWVVTSQRGCVVAIDGDGHQRWSNLYSNVTFAGSAAAAGETVVAAGVDGNVIAVVGK